MLLASACGGGEAPLSGASGNVGLISKTEPRFPHDVGRAVTAPMQSTFTFAARPFGEPLSARKIPQGTLPDAASRTSLYIDPLLASSKSSSPRSESPVFPQQVRSRPHANNIDSHRARRTACLHAAPETDLPDWPPHVPTLCTQPLALSNFSSPVGKSTYFSPRESFVNRSYYPLPLGRHTFSSRWTVPNVAARPW